MNEFAKAIIAVGITLVVAGVGLLGYLGYTVFMIIDAPENVKFVDFLLSHIGKGDKMLYGHVGREPFVLNLTEPARTVVLLFFGVVIFWIVAGIAKTIISAGIGIVRMFGTNQRSEK